MDLRRLACQPIDFLTVRFDSHEFRAKHLTRKIAEVAVWKTRAEVDAIAPYQRRPVGVRVLVLKFFPAPVINESAGVDNL